MLRRKNKNRTIKKLSEVYIKVNLILILIMTIQTQIHLQNFQTYKILNPYLIQSAPLSQVFKIIKKQRKFFKTKIN